MKLHPAYLWIGSDEELIPRTLACIKEQLCKKKSTSSASCNACADCTNVERRQHHLLLWLAPETTYTLAVLETVMQTIVYALQPDEHFFIVFEHAELFNASCANSLLKSLEEPPQGYHFILLAPRTEGILATIRSRCIVEYFASESETERHPLCAYFTPVSLTAAAAFTRELERAKMAERDVQPFLDQLTEYWYKQLLAGYAENADQAVQKAQRALEVLESARLLPVMPGSSKIFLKNLYLRLSIAF